eukprot:SM000053S17461  [mRNA]  locus=s53:517072:520297:+ [translate_table: standard]
MAAAASCAGRSSRAVAVGFAAAAAAAAAAAVTGAQVRGAREAGRHEGWRRRPRHRHAALGGPTYGASRLLQRLWHSKLGTAEELVNVVQGKGLLDRLTLRVVSLRLQPTYFAQEQKSIAFSDIVQIGDVLLVHDSIAPSEGPRPSSSVCLVGHEVITESGIVLGKVRDFAFDLGSGLVAVLVIDALGHPLVPATLLSTFALAANAINSLKHDRVVVRAGSELRLKQITMGVVDRWRQSLGIRPAAKLLRGVLIDGWRDRSRPVSNEKQLDGRAGTTLSLTVPERARNTLTVVSTRQEEGLPARGRPGPRRAPPIGVRQMEGGAFVERPELDSEAAQVPEPGPSAVISRPSRWPSSRTVDSAPYASPAETDGEDELPRQQKGRVHPGGRRTWAAAAVEAARKDQGVLQKSLSIDTGQERRIITAWPEAAKEQDPSGPESAGRRSKGLLAAALRDGWQPPAVPDVHAAALERRPLDF